MKTLALTFVIGVLTNFAFGQNEVINGIITNDNNQGIERAYVLVLDADDSTYVNGTITDANGHYEINLLKEGTFILSVDHVSFDAPKRIGVLNNETNNFDVEAILDLQAVEEASQLKSYEMDLYTITGRVVK